MLSPLNALIDTFCNDPVQPQRLRELVPLGEVRRYRKGTVLIHEADPGDTLFVVVEGRVKVYCTDDFEKEITFGVIGPATTLVKWRSTAAPARPACRRWNRLFAPW